MSTNKKNTSSIMAVLILILSYSPNCFADDDSLDKDSDTGSTSSDSPEPSGSTPAKPKGKVTGGTPVFKDVDGNILSDSQRSQKSKDKKGNKRQYRKK